jgi:hypothetical protein
MSELVLPTPDVGYRLPAAERGRVYAHFDADALEHLLRWIRPEHRNEVLSCFQRSFSATQSRLTFIGVPEVQAVLEEVWAPFWSQLPAAALDDPTMQIYPGREVARRRIRPA